MTVILFFTASALAGLWLFRRGLRQLRGDWRAATPKLDRFLARAVQPVELPAKTWLDHALVRMIHWTNVIGGAAFFLLGLAGLTFALFSPSTFASE